MNHCVLEQNFIVVCSLYSDERARRYGAGKPGGQMSAAGVPSMVSGKCRVYRQQFYLIWYNVKIKPVSWGDSRHW